jgi:AraC-like DNA-binding protein
LFLLLLSLIGLGRALLMMRHQNKVKLIAFGVKATLNALSVAVVAFYGDMALHGNQPVNSLRVLFIVANPVVLTLLFRPKGRDGWLMPLSLTASLSGTLALTYELMSRAGYVPEWSGLDGWFPDETRNVGRISTFYVVFIGGVLAALLRHKITWRWPQMPFVNQSTRWEFYYLLNGLSRCVLLLLMVVWGNYQSASFFKLIAGTVTLSFVIDSLVLLVWGTNREVFFQSEHGLPLTSRWTPEVELLVHQLKDPRNFSNSRYSLNDVGQVLGWSNDRISTVVRRDLGMTFKQVLNHYRLLHVDYLELHHPEFTKLERLQRSGFQSYASYHQATQRTSM